MHSSLKTCNVLRTWRWPSDWSKHVVRLLIVINCSADVNNWLIICPGVGLLLAMRLLNCLKMLKGTKIMCNWKMSFIFRCVYVVAKSACYLRRVWPYVCLSFRPSLFIRAAPIWNLVLRAFMHICLPKYILFLSVKINLYKTLLIDWSGCRFLVRLPSSYVLFPRMYQYGSHRTDLCDILYWGFF